MLEHIITDTFKHTLTDINHHSGINKCGNHTKCKNTVIQQKFQGQGYCNTCCGTDKDADKYDDKLYLMGSCHIFQKSFGSLDGVLI